MSHPITSIITVTYNAEKVLEKTILSIVNQTAFQNIEYIIIDGSSKDNTLALIKKYETKISKWISEPDKGIYDAMNKGLKLATGDFVWFINAGDEIFEPDTLEKILLLSPNADIYYGETLEMTEAGTPIGMRRLKAPKKLSWKSFQRGMLVCHQSILVKRSKANPYNLNYKIAADIEWVISALKQSHQIVNTHLILSKFAKGGTSGNNIKKALKERFQIMIQHYGLIKTIINHLIIVINFLWYLIFNRRF